MNIIQKSIVFVEIIQSSFPTNISIVCLITFTDIFYRMRKR